MKTLLLVRHAQAASMDTRVPDRERPLTAFGVQQAARVGHTLVQQRQQIDVMLVSGALRTQQTATILQQALQSGVTRSQIVDGLYLASEALLWDVVNQMDDQVNTMMIVARNPGLDALGRRFMPDLLPLSTAGTVEVRFDCASWSQVCEATMASARTLS